jgi:hypothetical protein
LQTHDPLTHVVPVRQLMHVAPPVPQNWLELPWRHVVDGPPLTPASQQPAQLAVVQTHDPLTHVVPVGQAMQATPFVPQCWLSLVWHSLFWQQPLGHVAAEQTLTHEPFSHCVPLGQVRHATPLEPQA